jgi:hypothetical protein
VLHTNYYMKITFSLLRRLITLFLLLCLAINSHAQYKQFKLSPQGDTLDIIDNKGLKQGKWVISVPELRGESGYDEEGEYKDDQKEGVWRLYTTSGDLIGVENYKYGGKDGLQQYYTYVGVLVREEEWHSVNPKAPYDTVAIYGTDNNQILGYKIVKVTQYSVPNGDWKYYNDQTGELTKQEHYDYGRLINPDSAAATGSADQVKTTTTTPVTDTTKKAPVKTPEILEYEKKYGKKKKAAMERTGQTGQ